MSSFHQNKSKEPLREFNVGAPEQIDYTSPPSQNMRRELTPEERMEMNMKREEAIKNAGKIGAFAKQRISILADTGRITSDVPVGEHTFTLRSLKSKEAREVTMSMFACKNDADASYEVRRQTLARSIFAVDGEHIELVVGGNDFELKLELIDEMEEGAILKLYRAYSELSEKVREQFNIKNEKDAKEVFEEIKK